MSATPPTSAALESFLADCRAALPRPEAAALEPGACRQSCIGADLGMSEQICGLVIAGDKTGTFSLPWLHDAHPEIKPDIAGFTVLSNFDGTPRVLLQTVELSLVTFGDIDASYTALDGPGVRDVAVWRGVHTAHWNTLLKPLGKEVAEDTPVVVERFACLYPAS